MNQRLTYEVPAWARGYVGLDFADKGRDRSGLDCWGLVRLVRQEVFGEKHPCLGEHYRSVRARREIADLIAGEMARAWQPLPSAELVGDVAVYKRKGSALHVGLMVARDRMLHCEERTCGSVVERIDGPTWLPRLVGVYRPLVALARPGASRPPQMVPAGQVRLLARPNAFSVARVDVSLPEGGTLLDILAAGGLKPGAGYRVFLDGSEIRREGWGHVRPKGGRLVTVAVVPRGGGGQGGDSNKGLRTVLTVVVIAAAIMAPYAIPELAGTMGGSFLSAGIILGGSLLVNALVPPPRPKLTNQEDSKRSPSIDGVGNEARPYGAVPQNFGENVFAPCYGGLPYTEIAGDDQYIRVLFLVSYGPQMLTDLKIGQTPIDQFEGVEYEIRQGYPDDPPLRLYPGTVKELQMALLLEHAPTAGSTGPLYVNSAVDIGGGDLAPWTDPVRATGFPDGNLNAVDFMAKSRTLVDLSLTSSRLYCKDLRAAVPADAVITGVTVVLRDASTFFQDTTAHVQIHNGASLGAAKAVDFTASMAMLVQTFGDPADLWGAVLTPAIVNDPTFGVKVWLSRGTIPGGRKMYLDSVSVDIAWHSDLDLGWRVRRSETAAEELSVDVTFPQGLVEIDGTAQLPRTVDVDVEYAEAGTGLWTRINSSSPTVRRQMDFLFRSFECPFLSGDIFEDRVAWGAGFPDAKPVTLPATGYSWVADGWVYAATAGTYVFAVDGSDAIDLTIRGVYVVSWYGEHAPLGSGGTPDFSVHAGSIALEHGWNRLYLRLESRSPNGGAVALGWKQPGDVAYSIVPAASLAQDAAGLTPGLRYRVYDTSAYGSTLSTTANSIEQVRRSKAWAVPLGQYDVRVRRLTDDTTDPFILDKVYWTTLRTIRLTDPINMPAMAKVALRIKATEQLNGTVDTFNLRAKSILPDWDATAGAWIARATSSPASCIRAVLQGPANKRPVGNARLNLPNLQEWHERCTLLGLQFNGVCDTNGVVYDVLKSIASIGRASPAVIDGLYGVVMDKPQATPVQHFTPRNSKGFTWTKVFPARPHAFRAQYVNRNAGYKRDELIVLDDGYELGGLDAHGNPAPTLPLATLFEPLELWGCTSAAEAWKHGRYNLAVARLRGLIYGLQTDVEHLVCNRGDLVLVSSDVTSWGQAAGRLVGVTVNGGGAVTAVELDEPVSMAAGGTYNLRVRFSDTSSALLTVNTVAGTTNALTLSAPYAGPPLPAPNDLFMFGEVGQVTVPLLVKGIEADRDLAAHLTFVDYAPAVFDADDAPPPGLDGGDAEGSGPEILDGGGPGDVPDDSIDGGGPMPAPATTTLDAIPVYAEAHDTPAIDSVRSGGDVAGTDAEAVSPRILVSTAPLSGVGPARQVQTRYRIIPAPGATDAPWRFSAPTMALGNASIEGAVPGATYEISTRYLDGAGKSSAWSQPTQHTVPAAADLIIDGSP